MFDNLGPYHIARLRAVANRCELLAIEQHAVSAAYAWDPSADVPFQRITISENLSSSRARSTRQNYEAVSRALSQFRPDVIAVAGWGYEQSMLAVTWATMHKVPVLVMSDSQEIDFPRTAVREWSKRRFLACCDGAIAAGTPHREYLVKLGMNADYIRLGYDVVDNEHFRRGAAEARANAPALRQQHRLPERYFLTTARFLEKKNLPRLIKAFANFIKARDASSPASSAWHLVVLGDGALRGDLERLAEDLQLGDRVLLPGFKQYSDLPLFYGLAEAFILASTVEQWGLVVNEAMASGLPVLVSERCGCASDLVRPGVNGYTFDPNNGSDLTRLMLRLVEQDDRRAMGRISMGLIEDWSPDSFAECLIELSETVSNLHRSRTHWFDRLIVRVLVNHRRWASTRAS